MSFIIAECGINHEGDFEKAKQLTETSAVAGVNAAKFQIFWGLGRLEKYEFTKEQWIEIKTICDSLLIEFMASPHCKEFDPDTIDFVDSLVKRHKIASPYLTNEKYVKYIASKGKPIYLSTGSTKHKDGMARMKEIKQALSWMPKADVTLLHCISKYPLKDPYYGKIFKLRRFGKPVGLSDHSLNKMIHCWPVIEKHFKLNDNCIDSNVSLNPEEFREMVRNIRNYESALKTI